jgi:hypothetical protein
MLFILMVKCLSTCVGVNLACSSSRVCYVYDNFFFGLGLTLVVLSLEIGHNTVAFRRWTALDIFLIAIIDASKGRAAGLNGIDRLICC